MQLGDFADRVGERGDLLELPPPYASTDFAVSVNRSISAGSSPAARAAATSAALAAASFGCSRRTAAAIAARAPFLVAVSARASAREAARARRPTSCMYPFTSMAGSLVESARRGSAPLRSSEAAR